MGTYKSHPLFSHEQPVHFLKACPERPLKDLTAVVQVSRQPIVLVAHPSLGVRTVADVVALAKEQPGLRYALGSGVGSAQHMVGQWFAKIAGVQLQDVAYRGGGQAINDLVAGHVKLGSLGSTPVVPHFQAGSLLISRKRRKPAPRASPTCRHTRKRV
jgi:tripartite-type tricarboxylate transporter receptor subunit TctC